MTKSYQMVPRVATIYNPGTAKILEDKFIVRPPFFGVLDGVSGLYDPAIGPMLFDGKSGGQKVVEIIENVFSFAKESEGLEDVVKKANVAVRDFCVSNNIPLDRADLLPGATFAFAKIGEDKVEIVQGGDCFAVWKKTNGEVGVTLNQNFSDEEEKIGILKEIIRKHGGNRDSAWKEYMPIAARFKIERVNPAEPYRSRGAGKDQEKKSVVLNGQPEGEKLWYRNALPRDELKTLLLLTDGMIEFEESRSPKKMAEIIFETYRRGGLEDMLSRIRDIEQKRPYTTHIAQAEATAVAIEF